MPDTCAFCAPRAGQTFDPRRQHQECALRSTVGGIGHLTNHKYWCEIAHDPDAGHTYRQSAILVWEWVQTYGLDAAIAVETERNGPAGEGRSFDTPNLTDRTDGSVDDRAPIRGDQDRLRAAAEAEGGDALLAADRALIGQQVVATLDRHDAEPHAIVTGKLVAVAESGEFAILDKWGFVHYCWPLLKLEPADVPEDDLDRALDMPGPVAETAADLNRMSRPIVTPDDPCVLRTDEALAAHREGRPVALNRETGEWTIDAAPEDDDA